MGEDRQVSSPTVAELLRPWLAQQYDELRVALSDLAEPENVHIARVRCRRLRSVLGGWRDHLPAHAPKLRRRLQHLGRSISRLRDLDVITELLETNPPADLPQWRSLMAADRAPVLADALLVASSPETADLLVDLGPLCMGDWGVAGSVDAVAAAAVVLDQERSRVEHVRTESGDQHDVRKASKRLRYNAEVIATVIPPAAQIAADAEATQEFLGAALDDTMVSAWIAEARARAGSGETT